MAGSDILSVIGTAIDALPSAKLTELHYASCRVIRRQVAALRQHLSSNAEKYDLRCTR